MEKLLKKFSTLIPLILLNLGGIALIFYVFFQQSFIWLLSLMGLAILGSLLLSDILAIWFSLFVALLGTICFMMGFVYMPVFERLLLILVAPVTTILMVSLIRLINYRLGSLTDNSRAAQLYYEKLQSQPKDVKVGLVEWAHSEQFNQYHSSEFKRVLKKINDELRISDNSHSQVFYLSDGKFIIFLSDISEAFQKVEALEKISFHQGKRQNHLQFKMVEKIMKSDEVVDTSFDDLLRALKRQLETVLVIEY